MNNEKDTDLFRENAALKDALAQTQSLLNQSILETSNVKVALTEAYVEIQELEKDIEVLKRDS